LTKYPVFIAPTRTGYSARVPDLPGCIAAGRTRDETLDFMQGAIEMHLRAKREDGDPIPEPSQVEILEVA
jgi:predicted RNase H-like HicB family nuclease